MTTRRVTLLAAALLGGLAAPGLAQEQTRPREQRPGAEEDAGRDQRRISRTEDDQTTTLTARQEGQLWRVELVRRSAKQAEGPTSEQRTVLMFPTNPEREAALDRLFQDPPQDPDRWASRVEEIAGVQLDLDQGPAERGDDGLFEELKDVPAEAQDELQRAVERARREWREALRRLRDVPFPGRPEGAQDGPDQDKVYLRNGDVISGKILEVDPLTVRIDAPGGEVQVPRDRVRRIEFERPAHPILGVTLAEAEGGARVANVASQSPAARAGLQEGDLITAFAGQEVRDVRHLRSLVWAQRVGDEVELSIQRDGATKDLKVRLGQAHPPPD